MVKKSSDLFESFEIKLYEATVKASPNNVNALRVLGYLYTKQKNHLKALEIDRRLTLLKPEDAVVYYNLACSLSNLGKIPDALEALEMSVLLGYSDLKHLESDPDLDNIRNEPRYQQVVRKLNR